MTRETVGQHGPDRPVTITGFSSKVTLSAKTGVDTLDWDVPLVPNADSISVLVKDEKGIVRMATYRFSIRTSRIIGNLNTVSLKVDAYAWNGGIVHVSQDSVGKISIGIFNPLTGKDSTLASPKIKKGDDFNFSVAHSGSKIYLIGARLADFPQTNITIYDLVTGTWEAGPNFASLDGSRAGIATNEKLFVVYPDSGRQGNRLGILDIKSNIWSYKQPFGAISDHARFTEISGKIYCFLGYGGQGFMQILEYKPNEEKWLDFPRPIKFSNRVNSHIVGVKGDVYIFGGQDPYFTFDGAGSYLNSVEIFNSTEKEWVPITPMLVSKSDFGLVNIGSKIFILGGNGWRANQFGGGSYGITSVEEYQP